MGTHWVPSTELQHGTFVSLDLSATVTPLGKSLRCPRALASRSPLPWALSHFGLFSISLLDSPHPLLLNVGIAPGFNSVPPSLLMTCSPQVTSCVFKTYRRIIPNISF